MSQHRFSTKPNGRPIEILMGLDRPLQGSLMVMAREDNRPNEDELVYGNPSIEALTDCDGLPATLENFLAAPIAGHGSRLPNAMVAEVGQDARGNLGNRTVVHPQECAGGLS